MKVKYALLGLSALTLAGCASSSNVYQIQPGVYQVSATGDGYTTADRVVDLAMTKAGEHCKVLGKAPIIVRQQQARTRMGIDTTLTVWFRCG